MELLIHMNGYRDHSINHGNGKLTRLGAAGPRPPGIANGECKPYI